MVVLNKADRIAYCRFKLAVVEAFNKKPALVAKYFEFDEQYVWNSQWGEFHDLKDLLFQNALEVLAVTVLCQWLGEFFKFLVSDPLLTPGNLL